MLRAVHRACCQDGSDSSDGTFFPGGSQGDSMRSVQLTREISLEQAQKLLVIKKIYWNEVAGVARRRLE